ncbi:MAG: glycosyltransferase 87 family protein [Nitrososphaerota archaeon]|nr:glycosyltransferase 87 family protein [Candidatus Geocrenenecus dongiae]
MRIPKIKLDLKFALVAATLSFITSYIIHHPKVPGNIYSDIMSFWYRPLVRDVLIPYVNYEFEYPPLAGLVTYVSALIGGGQLIPYYNVFSAIVFLSHILLITVVYRLAVEKNIPTTIVLIFSALSPSLIMYSNYNFDTIYIALLITSLALFEKGKLKSSALLFSASILMKLTSILLLPLLLFHINNKKDRLTCLFYVLVPIISVNLILQFLNHNFIDETYFYHVRWGLENAWFVYLFPQRDWWDTAKIFSFLLMLYALSKIYLKIIDGDGNVYEYSFMIFSAFLLTSYVFTPQMVIWLLPFMALMNPISTTFYIAYTILEVANVGIILTWFMEEDPLAAGSIPQNLALIRAAALFYLLLQVYYNKAGKKMVWRTNSLQEVS